MLRGYILAAQHASLEEPIWDVDWWQSTLRLSPSLLSALGGSAVSYLFANPVQPSLGASGAVFGILGATLVVSRRLRYDVRGVTVLIGINLALGFVIEGIDWRAHVGGLITGMAVAYAFAYAPRERRTLIGVGACVLVFLATIGIVAFRTAQLTG